MEETAVPMDNSTPNKHFTALRDNIAHHFDLGELNTLCFDLGVDFDELPGQTKTEKAQNLLANLNRRNRIPVLIEHLKKQRPHVDWEPYQPAELKAEPPFKGLQYFDEKDAHLFFGREQLTTELVDHLRQHRFLAVVGASGSGKSSVVRAGVIPAVRRGDIEQNGRSSTEWPIHVITCGNDPLKALAASLTRDNESVTAMKTLLTDLKTDVESLDLYLYRQMTDQPNCCLLLVVDQFEELFTQCNDLYERQLFVENLVTSVRGSSQLSLILILRADFYAHALQYEVLRPFLETQQKIVGTMNPEELRRAITAPAEQMGWKFQSGLVETMLQDTGQEPGALPLLSHALQETWERREGRVMTLAGYHAAGGVKEAIATTANNLYGRLSSKQQIVTQRILLRLIELGDNLPEARCQIKVNELFSDPIETPIIMGVLDTLVKARLIISDSTSVELAHEALIHHWPLYQEWLKDNREVLVIHHQLKQSVSSWVKYDRHEDFLVIGKQLAIFEEWHRKHPDVTNILEEEFLEGCRHKERQIILAKERAKAIEARIVLTNKLISFTFVVVILLAVMVVGFLLVFKLPPFSPAWRWLNGPKGGTPWNLLIDPINTNIVYVANSNNGVYKSIDSGKNWFVAGTGLVGKTINLLVADPQSASTIYAVSREEGIFRTQDNGENWYPINEGLPTTSIITYLAVSHDLPSRLYLTTWGKGIWSTPTDRVHWEQITELGLLSSSIHKVVITKPPTILYASASHKGLFRSWDLGENWELVGFLDNDIVDISISPWDQNFIYVREATNGPYVSIDQGETWLSIAKEIQGTPRSEPYFYLDNGNETIALGTFNGLIFRSHNNGKNWEVVSSNLPSAFIRDIKVLPALNDLLISTSSGVYISHDDGNSWELTGPEILRPTIITGLPGELGGGILVGTNSGIYRNSTLTAWGTLNKGLQELEIVNLASANAPPIALTGIGNLYELRENDMSWQVLNLPQDEKITIATSLISETSPIFVATESNKIYRTSNKGLTWDYLEQFPSEITQISGDPQSSEVIYIGTLINGIYKSNNNGEDWLPINEGITNPTINDIEIASDIEGLIYIATNNGVFISKNEGDFWVQSTEGLTNPLITSLESHPTYNGMVYAGTTGGFYVSLDYGQTWDTLEKGLLSKDISSIWANDQYVYIGTSLGIYYIEHPVTPLVHWYEEKYTSN